MQSTKDNGPNYQDWLPDPNYLPDAGLSIVSKQYKMKQEFRIPTSFHLFFSNTWLQAPTIWSPHSLWREEIVLEAHACCVLLSASLRIKAIFLFPPDSVSVIFISLWWAEKAKILLATATGAPRTQIAGVLVYLLTLGLVAGQILAFSAHQSRIKKKYAEFGGNGRMALIFRWQRGEHSRLMLQELCPHGPSLPPPHEESRGLYEGSQPGVSDKEQRCYDLSSSSCIVSKTFISKHQ